MDELESKDFSSRRVPRTALGLAGTAAVLLVCNGYFAWRGYELGRDLQRMRISNARDLAELRENYESSSNTNNRTLKLLIEELTAVRQEAVNAAGKARTEAQRHAERLARRMEQAQGERAKRIDRMATELDEVKSSATTTQASLATVSSQVAATKSELATAASDLKRA